MVQNLFHDFKNILYTPQSDTFEKKEKAPQVVDYSGGENLSVSAIDFAPL